MGKTNWFASVVKAIVAMYTNGTKMRNTSGRKTSHMISARLTSLLISLLRDGWVALDAELMNSS